jgi:16S rRNA (cytidine1402-2'-O)-methyltransferase
MHEHSSASAIEGALERLRRGERLALVSDAGTPLVSDPGAPLVRAARAEGHRVTPIPGASAVVAALSATAIGDGRFRFFGFLPREGAERRDAIATCADTEETVVLYEAPHRLAATLRDFAEAMPTRRAVVLRELTKLHEEQIEGDLDALAALEREWIGEIVLVLAPWEPRAREAAIGDEAIDARIDELFVKGERAKRISELLAAWSGRPKRELYERVVGRKPR